jgi:uncharacterized protein YdeI (BOF family)
MKRILSLAIVVLLVSCNERKAASAKEVLANPSVFDGKEVTISGTVWETYSFIGFKYYKIKDGAGEIVVIPVSETPASGQSVKVKGSVKKIQRIGNNPMIVIIEEERASKES